MFCILASSKLEKDMTLDNVVDIVRRASGLMVQNGFEVIQKDGPANVVTSSDLAVQHFLVKELVALLPRGADGHGHAVDAVARAAVDVSAL